MKNHFDKHAEGRVFTSGDQVLILLPSSGSPFCAKFTGHILFFRNCLMKIIKLQLQIGENLSSVSM